MNRCIVTNKDTTNKAFCQYLSIHIKNPPASAGGFYVVFVIRLPLQILLRLGADYIRLHSLFLPQGLIVLYFYIQLR